MSTTFAIIQIVLAVLLIAMILMQQSDSSLGSAFGGSDSGGLHHTRRGFEKFLFYGTIVVAIAFLGLSVWNLVL
jgi:protein translocase SecG subunit